ncbi:hypothetical protein C8N43_3897 [Litoreibacter ponti]|uniref:Uncharacterized protein n=1 Tax=Litoreibacter ponti TaxID=1510457 RepID=A0A2T6BCT3_9RHOB|nr:hypothetical protein [Litoreibacter ponti]PTX53854.1 hypothetical protein C8N43_3897 [Litoreibacter ponti]
MSFYTRIKSKDNLTDETSDLSAIGNAIKDLSFNANAALTSPPTGETPFMDLEGIIGSDDADLSAAGTKICNALAITKVKKDTSGGWSEGDIIGPGACTSLTDNIKVRFVFEGEDEIIIAVPHQSVLDYGLAQGRPMGEPKYIEKLVGSARELAAGIESAIIAELGHTIADQVRPLIETELDELQKKTDAAGDDESLFFEQLGSYPIRQCG